MKSIRNLIIASLTCIPAFAQLPEDYRQQITTPLIPELVSGLQDLDYEGLLQRLPERPTPLTKLDFDPAEARYFDLIAHELELTEEEIEIYCKQGFVSLDNQRDYSFTTAYHNVYTSDLPVLITTDSILYALHKSYEEILKELEMSWFTTTLIEVMGKTHKLLAERASSNLDKTLAVHYRDVDLYLTITRQLLAGAGSPGQPLFKQPKDPERQIESQLDQGEAVDLLLQKIASLNIEVPFLDTPTSLYGGKRYLDYSQFRPRGHYAQSPQLQNYFRAMMWLSRADTGWNVLPVDKETGLVSDDRRELGNAVLFVELLRDSGGLERMRAIDRMINYMVGSSDSLNLFALAGMMGRTEINTVADLAHPPHLEGLQAAIRQAASANQIIRSQVLVQNDDTSSKKVVPPALFQVFGQRFTIDAYALSRLVYDAIYFEGKKQRRMMPTGLDVMAALGNDTALHLLEPELRRWNYSANLLATRTFVGQQKNDFWDANLYSLWLGSLRHLDVNLTARPHAPQSMQTEAWQRKQLQTQLASWSQLRHNTVLYSKQSYTTVPGCEYLDGYVEPYPEFYAGIKKLARRAHELIKATPFTSETEYTNTRLARTRSRQLQFFSNMATRMEQLETLARKELNAEPFTSEERDFLKHTISNKGSAPLGSSSAIAFYGWYTELFYADQPRPGSSMGGGYGGLSKFPPSKKNAPGNALPSWRIGGGVFRYGRSDMIHTPTITDVHTNPKSKEVLQVGVGYVNLCVIAVDNEDDLTAFVGPVFSYHEFSQPAQKRLTDQEWNRRLRDQSQSARPSWTDCFAAKPVSREPQGKIARAIRHPNGLSIDKSPITLTNEGLAALANYPTLRSLDLSAAPLTDEGLRPLSDLTDLRNVSLSMTAIDGSGLKVFRDAKWLRRVLLAKTRVSDESLGHLTALPRLEILDLQETPITVAAIDHLKKMTFLRELDLRNTAIDEASVTLLQRVLPKCRIRH